MDLNLLPYGGHADEDLLADSSVIDDEVLKDVPLSSDDDASDTTLHPMTEDIPNQWLTWSAATQNQTVQSNDLVSCQTQIIGSDLQGQKPTTDEHDKLTELTLGNFAGNTSQPLPRLPETSNATLNAPLCKRANLSSKEKARTYKKFSVEEIEKLIEGVEKYGGKYCNWKTIKNLYFKDSDRKKDQLKEKWRHMQNSADKQTDPSLKKLYMRALNVQMSAPKSKSSKCKEEVQK